MPAPDDARSAVATLGAMSSPRAREAASGPGAQLAAPVFDTDERSFDRDVIERSHQVPVIVDFWAGWCAPCRMLAPVLERAVEARGGEVLLAKVDVDANPGLAARYGVRGIPAVKAFRDGGVVAEFTGAQPPAAVDAFLARVVPSRAERLASEGARTRDEAKLREALALDPRNREARVALARLVLERGELAEAAALLEEVAGDFVADGLRARVALLEAGGPDLSRLARAFELADRGAYRESLELLEAELAGESDRERRDLLRRVMVGIFAELGQGDPLATEFRRRLAALVS